MASNFEEEVKGNSNDQNKENLKKLTSLKAEIDGVLKNSQNTPEKIAEKITNEIYNTPTQK